MTKSLRKPRMTSSDEAKPCDKQIKSPCKDCPMHRNSIPGWLGDRNVEGWILYLHGETRIDCHTLIGPQCAGVAIYRSNVGKIPRSKEILRLPADRDTVFASPKEFQEHHNSIPAPIKSPVRKAIEPERTVRRILEFYEDQIASSVMSKEEALEVTDDLIEELMIKKDSLQ